MLNGLAKTNNATDTMKVNLLPFLNVLMKRILMEATQIMNVICGQEHQC